MIGSGIGAVAAMAAIEPRTANWTDPSPRTKPKIDIPHWAGSALAMQVYDGCLYVACEHVILRLDQDGHLKPIVVDLPRG